MNKKTILLVEDEAIIALRQKHMLSANNYNVLLAIDGEQAIEAVEAGGAIDLILMDIDLGKGMDGPSAASVIQRNYDIPIIFLSSHPEHEVVDRLQPIIYRGYIIKSARSTLLLSGIAAVFNATDGLNNTY